MLDELRSCRNYSDLEKQMKILNVLRNSNRQKNELELFFSADAVVRSNLTDDLILLESLGYIEIIKTLNEIKYKIINGDFSRQSLSQALFTVIIQNNIGDLVIIGDSYFITIDSEYYALRNLLYIEDIISKSHLPKMFKVNDSFNSYLKKYRKQISKEQFKANLERNEEIGLKAEKFVKLFEENRLGGNKLVKHISIQDNNAGYDLLSYLDEKSLVYDKFIEVKCYSETKKVFYISKNEILTSERLGDNYFLYLINSNFTVQPLIIRNPSKSIFNNVNYNFEIEVRKYEIDSLEV